MNYSVFLYSSIVFSLVQLLSISITDTVSTSSTSQAMATHEPPTIGASVRTMVEKVVDRGSLTYMRNFLAREDTLVANSHFNDTIQTMRCIRSGGEKSCWMYSIYCPSGTCMTTSTITILGTILHRSFPVHVGGAQHPSIPSQVDKLKCARKGIHLQLLLVTSSNAAVENILLRLHRDGVPYGKGRWICPQVVQNRTEYWLAQQCSRYDRDWGRRYPT